MDKGYFRREIVIRQYISDTYENRHIFLLAIIGILLIAGSLSSVGTRFRRISRKGGAGGGGGAVRHQFSGLFNGVAIVRPVITPGRDAEVMQRGASNQRSDRWDHRRLS